MDGKIINITRFCTDDGPGIRTSVFLKRCPLKCAWCHNPESQSAKNEIMYDPTRCVSCMECAKRCFAGCHTLRGSRHIFSRSACIGCGECAACTYT